MCNFTSEDFQQVLNLLLACNAKIGLPPIMATKTGPQALLSIAISPCDNIDSKQFKVAS